ncbi:hypothetical protein HMPREF9104_00424, partial [Lentilactobacillus kisonensis F0435]
GSGIFGRGAYVQISALRSSPHPCRRESTSNFTQSNIKKQLQPINHHG